MKSNEARIAEAVASLTARLEAWGVADAAEKAHAYVNDMLREGWRPRALPVPSVAPTVGKCPPSEDYRAARANLAGRPEGDT